MLLLIAKDEATYSGKNGVHRGWKANDSERDPGYGIMVFDLVLSCPCLKAPAFIPNEEPI